MSKSFAEAFNKAQKDKPFRLVEKDDKTSKRVFSQDNSFIDIDLEEDEQSRLALFDDLPF